MTVVIIERGEQGYEDVGDLTEAQAQDTVRAVSQFFLDFIDEQYWRNVDCFLSKRAENVLRYNTAVTVGDVWRCLLKSQSSSKLAGAGVLVQTEWARLLQTARTSRKEGV